MRLVRIAIPTILGAVAVTGTLIFIFSLSANLGLDQAKVCKIKMRPVAGARVLTQERRVS